MFGDGRAWFYFVFGLGKSTFRSGPARDFGLKKPWAEPCKSRPLRRAGILNDHEGNFLITFHEQSREDRGNFPRSATDSAELPLEQPRRKVLEVPAPGLPLVVRAGGFVEHMLDARLLQRSVQT